MHPDPTLRGCEAAEDLLGEDEDEVGAEDGVDAWRGFGAAEDEAAEDEVDEVDGVGEDEDEVGEDEVDEVDEVASLDDGDDGNANQP